MAKLLNSVIHFQGSEVTWKDNILTGQWNDNIVFGIITDSRTGKISKRIYAGKNSRGVDYEYKTAVSVESFESAEALMSDTNLGLLITVINNETPEENGTYIVTYNEKNEISLLKIGEGGASNIHIDVSTCDPSEYYEGKTPAHGDYYVKEEPVSDNPNVEPRRTAYIFDSTLKEGLGEWVVLDGNVSAENVYFPNGFQRTKEWGTAKAKEDTGSDEAIIGKNLKEIFEYYLVEELFKGTVTNATFSTDQMVISATGTPQPKNVSNYITVSTGIWNGNTMLAEVGAAVNVKKIEVKGIPSVSNVPGYKEGRAASIVDMFDYSIDGVTKVGQDSSISAKPRLNFSYNNNFEDAVATLSLTVTGVSGMSSQTATGLVNTSVALSSTTGNVNEGSQKLLLDYSNDLEASRDITGITTSKTITLYPVSNKGNVSTGTLTATGLTPSDDKPNASKGSSVVDTTSNVVIKGVYPIFTNGKTVTEAEIKENGQSICNWYNNTYSDQANNKLALFDYVSTSSKNYILTFGPNNNDDTKYPIVLIPENMIDINASNEWDFLNAKWSAGLNSRTVWTLDGSTMLNINGVSKKYLIYTSMDDGVGASAFKLIATKHTN